MARTFDVEVEGIRDLVDALRATPERLDKEMRKEFRALAKDTERKARASAQAARPVATTRKHQGTYRWTNLVNSIKAGAESDTPTISYGSERVKGWAGWEFGSDRLPNFPSRTARQGRGNRGRFFFPAVLDEARTLTKRTNEIVNRYAETAFGH